MALATRCSRDISHRKLAQTRMPGLPVRVSRMPPAWPPLLPTTAFDTMLCSPYNVGQRAATGPPNTRRHEHGDNTGV